MKVFEYMGLHFIMLLKWENTPRLRLILLVWLLILINTFFFFCCLLAVRLLYFNISPLLGNLNDIDRHQNYDVLTSPICSVRRTFFMYQHDGSAV